MRQRLADVRNAVRRLVDECGRGGGYILAPAHHVQADTPLGNTQAFYEEGLRTPSESFRGTDDSSHEEGD